jgi:undecaprenyl-diphosphatase
MNELLIAVILGVVEGLTEFLPVSSTGHLIIVESLLNFSDDKAKCFAVFIQLGAILAVVVLYWRRFVGLIPTRGLTLGPEAGFSGLRGLACLFVTTVPAGLLGLAAHRVIKAYLFKPVPVAIALAVGAVGILLAERYQSSGARTEDLDGLTFRQALTVGLFQCLSLWPGMSRAAATIVGGLLSGLDRKTAAEYSFLAAVPIMVAATSYDVLKSWHLLAMSDLPLFATGFVVSFVSAAVAVKTFITLVQRWSLAPYAWYRLAIAPVIYFMWSS